MKNKTTAKNQIIFCLLIITGLAVLLYYQTLNFLYVWDDSLLFLDKTNLLNSPLTWDLLTEPVLPGTTYMRPLVFLTMYFEFNILGQSPKISHTINLIIFILNSWLVFLLCLMIAKNAKKSNPIFLALLAALFYSVHPALVESTAWVSGRFDALVTFFILLGCIIYLSKINFHFRIVLICIFFMAALLSKELGALLPAVLICLWLAYYNKLSNGLIHTITLALRENLILLLAMSATLIFYIYLRNSAMSSIYHSEFNSDYRQWAWFENLLPIKALNFYIQQTLIPFSTVNPLHKIKISQEITLQEIIMNAFTILLIVYFLFYSITRRSTASWLFMAALALITPVLYIVPITIDENIGHERFMTAPLAFFAIAIVMIDYSKLFSAIQVNTRRVLLTLISSLWLLLAAWTTYTTAGFWYSDLTLWNWALHSNPDSQYARYNYLYGALKSNRYDLVEKQIRIELDKNKGLNVGDQLLYSNMLIRNGDIEGMRYLEGVLYALPKFHEMPDGKEKIKNFRLTGLQMAGAYNDYSNSLMLFKGDAKEALKYNLIAEFYLAESEKIPLYYTRTAIYYGLGRYAEAQELYQSLEHLYYSNKEHVKKTVPQILSFYCQQPASNKDICAELMKKNIINSTDLSRPN